MGLSAITTRSSFISFLLESSLSLGRSENGSPASVEPATRSSILMDAPILIPLPMPWNILSNSFLVKFTLDARLITTQDQVLHLSTLDTLLLSASSQYFAWTRGRNNICPRFTFASDYWWA